MQALMGRWFLLKIALPVAVGVFLGLWAASLLADERDRMFAARARVTGINSTADPEFRYYNLTFSGDNGGLLIIIDKQLPLTHWLERHSGGRVRVVFEAEPRVEPVQR